MANSGAAIVIWGCREAAPLEEIAQCVEEVSDGSVFIRQYPTDISDYSIIIADHEISDEEAERMWVTRGE